MVDRIEYLKEGKNVLPWQSQILSRRHQIAYVDLSSVLERLSECVLERLKHNSLLTASKSFSIVYSTSNSKLGFQTRSEFTCYRSQYLCKTAHLDLGEPVLDVGKQFQTMDKQLSEFYQKLDLLYRSWGDSVHHIAKTGSPVRMMQCITREACDMECSRRYFPWQRSELCVLTPFPGSDYRTRCCHASTSWWYLTWFPSAAARTGCCWDNPPCTSSRVMTKTKIFTRSYCDRH